jgi:hypothetical protein
MATYVQPKHVAVFKCVIKALHRLWSYFFSLYVYTEHNGEVLTNKKRIKLKLTVNIGILKYSYCLYLAHKMKRWSLRVNTVVKLPFSIKGVEFLDYQCLDKSAIRVWSFRTTSRTLLPFTSKYNFTEHFAAAVYSYSVLYSFWCWQKAQSRAPYWSEHH